MEAEEISSVTFLHGYAWMSLLSGDATNPAPGSRAALVVIHTNMPSTAKDADLPNDDISHDPETCGNRMELSRARLRRGPDRHDLTALQCFVAIFVLAGLRHLRLSRLMSAAYRSMRRSCYLVGLVDCGPQPRFPQKPTLFRSSRRSNRTARTPTTLC